MKHTPGPWEAISPIRAIGITGGPDGRFICHIAGTSEFGVLRSAEADANARLIAAAPDLLAALKALVPLAELRTTPHEHVAGIGNACAVARAAIKKAEGER